MLHFPRSLRLHRTEDQSSLSSGELRTPGTLPLLQECAPLPLPRLYTVFPEDPSTHVDTTVDIIAVHGIETCSPKTWTAFERDKEPRGREVNWLIDENMLPRVVPRARVWVFDYNSRYSSDAQVIGIKNMGDIFLQHMVMQRLGTRPIIFIGSCFGGIVVAQALRSARNEHEKLLQCTKGIIFLGTPFRGSKAKPAAEWRVFVTGVIGNDNEASTTLLKDLEENSSHLEELVEEFGAMTMKYGFEIRCFFETRKTQVLNAVLDRRFTSLLGNYTNYILVEKSSACLDCHERIPLEVRHAMINKFRGPDDDNFKIVSAKIAEIFEKAQTREHRTPDERACMISLSTKYEEQKDRNPKRVSGTCEWFLKHPMFRKWRRDSTEVLLWVTAGPGCGKSVLCKALLDEGLVAPDEPTVRTFSTCYFFFKDDDPDRCSGADALRAILHQLFKQRPVLLKHAMPDFENYGERFPDMFGILWNILMKATADPDAGPVVCVLDALDECEGPAREALIEKLAGFCLAQHKRKPNLKFLVTSRPYADIKAAFCYAVDDLPSINLEGDKESASIGKEIDLVIEYEIPRITRGRSLDKETQEFLVKHLKSMDNRTYLWLHLILDEIQRSLESSQRQLRKLLKEIPSSVDTAYERILNRVTDSKLVNRARGLLHIVVSAERPLTLQETNVALAILEKLENGENCNSESDLETDSPDTFEQKVQNLCGLFISIVDSKVYLIHQTAREFLVNRNRFDMPSNLAEPDTGTWKHSLALQHSNALMAKVCISYLLFSIFERAPLKIETTASGGIVRSVVDQYCNRHYFLNYAAKNFAAHFRQATIKGQTALLESTLKVCDTQSNRFLTWFRVYWITMNSSSEYPRGVTDLMIGSHFGLEVVVRRLLEGGAEVATEDSCGRIALHWAASYGHETVVRLLLEKEANVNSKDSFGETPLCGAVRSTNEEVVWALLCKGADPYSVNKDGETVLAVAMRLRNKVIVNLLTKSANLIDPALWEFHIQREVYLQLGYVLLRIPVNSRHIRYLAAFREQEVFPETESELDRKTLELDRDRTVKFAYILFSVPVSLRHQDYLAAVRGQRVLPEDESELYREKLELDRDRCQKFGYVAAWTPREYLTASHEEQAFTKQEAELERLDLARDIVREFCSTVAEIPPNSQDKEYPSEVYTRRALPPEEAEFKELDLSADGFRLFCDIVARLPIDSQHNEYLAAIHGEQASPEEEAEFKDLDFLAEGFRTFCYVVARVPINLKHKEYLVPGSGQQISPEEKAEFKVLDLLANDFWNGTLNSSRPPSPPDTARASL